MKNPVWRLCLAVALAGLGWLGQIGPAAAQERGGQGERLDRLERQIQELAQRQEQFMHRLESQAQRPSDAWQSGPPGIRGPRPGDALQGPPGEKAAKGLRDLIGLLFLIGIICNILLAIWIFTDIRKRGEGSGIFIAVALVAGIPAALIYSLTRIAEKKP